MKRTRQKTKKPPADAILVSDLHLTDSVPVSRTDDYIEAQKKKLEFLQQLSYENRGCPILCAGDVFDRWKASPWLCAWAFSNLPRPFIGIPGQHDLPMHSFEQYNKSALSLLERVSNDKFEILKNEVVEIGNLIIVGVAFGKLTELRFQKIKEQSSHSNKRKILILHELVWPKQKPPWSPSSWTDLQLLKEFGGHFDLILTGDNHTPFTTKQRNSLLVNPGSMLRMNTAQEDHKPRCYLYYSHDNSIKPVYLPIKKNVHNREHLDKRKDRDKRIAAYINNISHWENEGLSFRKNLESFFAENKVSQKVKEVILWHLEKENDLGRDY